MSVLKVTIESKTSASSSSKTDTLNI